MIEVEENRDMLKDDKAGLYDSCVGIAETKRCGLSLSTSTGCTFCWTGYNKYGVVIVVLKEEESY